MVAIIVRRLLLSIPLVLLASFLAFALSRLAGGSYFDQFKTDRRYDLSQVRRWERDARLDRPVWIQFLYWLRGVCFDVRWERPREHLSGFESALVEGEDYQVSAGWQVKRTGDESVEGFHSMGLQAPDARGWLRLPVPAGRSPFTEVGVSLWSDRQAEVEIAEEGGPARAVATLPAREWRELTLSCDPAAAIVLHVDRPTRICIDELCAVAKHRKWSLGRPDFGRSFFYDTPVFDLLMPNLVNSLVLALLTLFVTFFVAIPLGTWCAVHRNSWGDRLMSGVSFLGMSVPSFFFALLALYVAVEVFNPLFDSPPIPVGLDRSEHYDQMGLAGKLADRLRHLLLPVLVLSAGSLAAIQRLTRGSLLETLRSGYVTAARAKGLPEHRVIYRHALRNALPPLVTIFGYRLAEMLSGAALVEIVFQYPGMGKFVLQATISRDLYVVIASVFVGALVLTAANLCADMLLAAIDPRIDWSRSGAA